MLGPVMIIEIPMKYSHIVDDHNANSHIAAVIVARIRVIIDHIFSNL